MIVGDFADKDFRHRANVLTNAIYQVFEPIDAAAFAPEERATRQSPLADFAREGEVVLYG